ncbi:chemotaxis protein CheD [bacterium]|nr:chemotaxis protein CheD [bacterium]
MVVDTNLFVKAGELKTAQAPSVLKSVLGSCVGLTIWDPVKKIAGLAHIFMPKSDGKIVSDNLRAKFADTAVHELVNEILAAGSRKYNLEAKLIGGCNMLGKDGALSVGKRNAMMVKEKLRELHIHLIYEDVGGKYGRYIALDCESGELTVKTLGQE